MSLILKMQINDQSENKYIFSTENGEIELIPLSVIANGEYTPESGKAFSTVTVSVPQTVLEQLNITSNGTYEASSGHAYDVVTVNVQPILDILVDTVTENGTYVYEPDEGYDGLEEVRVTVSVPEPVFEHLTRTITSNGTYNYSPSTGKDGFDEAQITVNVPQPQPLLEQKSEYYDTNGNYTIQPSQGYDGISEVSVEVDVSGSQPTVATLDLTGSDKVAQNGTYHFYPSTYSLDYFDGVDLEVDVSGGGGGSNIITNTFNLSSSGDNTIQLSIPTGKEIKAIFITPEVNDSYDGYSAVKAVSGNRVNYYYSAIKDESEINPLWFIDGQYKSGTSYNGGMKHDVLPTSTSNSGILTTVAINNSNLIVYGKLYSSTSTSLYGFATGITYRYYIILE